MDVDLYYKEQDERMDMQDDMEDEILESLNAYASTSSSVAQTQAATMTIPSESVAEPTAEKARSPLPMPRCTESQASNSSPSLHKSDMPLIPSAYASDQKTSLYGQHGSIESSHVTKTPRTPTKSRRKQGHEPTVELPLPRRSPRINKRKNVALDPATASTSRLDTTEDITSFSIIEERPPKRTKIANAKPFSSSRAKKAAPQKPTKLQMPSSPSAPKLSADAPTSPIEDPSGFIGSSTAVLSAPSATKSGRLLMALEERIASHRTSGSLSSKTMKRPTDKASKEKTDDVVKSGATTKTSKQRGESSRKAAASIQPKPEPKIEPTTYAQYVKQARKEQSQSAATTQNLFAGMIIYLLIADDDMEDVRCKVDCLIVHGAKVLLYYRPEACTHIITAEPSLDPSLLVRMRIDSVDEIPKHIKIFNWNFVVSVLNNLIAAESQIYAKKAAQGRNYNVADEILPENRPPGYFIPPQELWPEYFACPEREGSPKLGIDVHQRNSQTADMIDSKEATASPPHAAAASPSLSPDAPNPGSASDANGVPTPGSSSDTPEKPASTNIDPSDPLAEFYEQAKKDRVKENAPAAPNAQLLNDIANWWDLKQDVGKEGKEEKEGAWWDRAEETEDEDGVEDSPVKKGKKKRGKRGFTCDIKPAPGARGPCPNQDVVDTLTELMGLHKVKPGDDHHWRAFSYQKSLKAIRDYPHRIRSVKEAKKIPGVGEKTADKIMEIIHTGNLRRLHHEHTEDVDVLRLFQGIYGVGQATAVNWYAWGCRTLEDIKEGKHGVKLTTCQKIGLKYYDDLQLRMPREEVQALFDVIVPYARRIDPKLELRAMGSFRRGKKDCGDIDIMITRPTDDGETHAGALRELLLKLHRADILTEDLAVPDDLDDPECVYHGLCHLPKTPGAKQRRIDFLAVPWKSRGAALIYYTGDDIFNRAMRYKAGSMGYSLNQKGLYAGVVRDVHDRRIKTNRGNIIASETEEEIFKILGVPWQEPCERVRNH